MLALTIGIQHPGAKLGVAKLCCLKCWLMLQKIYRGVFNRTLATHSKTFPWPPLRLLASGDGLAKLFRGYGKNQLPKSVADALLDEEQWPALAAAIYAAESAYGTNQTGYASSQEAPTSPPSMPHLPELDQDVADADEAHEDYLDADVLLTPGEVRDGRGPDQAAQTSDRPPAKDQPLHKTKRVTPTVTSAPLNSSLPGRPGAQFGGNPSGNEAAGSVQPAWPARGTSRVRASSRRVVTPSLP
ncbi:hypothetical protein J5X84_04415 [Streptosporangiaceae bacterium NEAU-GS5]|nr:hypothetical protein [Streptosporangiaceae bacterium NEAU-GS5]